MRYAQWPIETELVQMLFDACKFCCGLLLWAGGGKGEGMLFSDLAWHVQRSENLLCIY